MNRETAEQELKAVLNSGVVRENTQLHSLLAYLGTRAAEDTGETLKEHRIGVEALGKAPEYDPRIDPTVRVEVAKLRRKLEEFYRGPGARHAVRIVIPKGAYLPVFTAAGEVRGNGVNRWLARARWVAVCLLAVAAILPWVSPRRPTLAPELEAFWGPNFTAGARTMLIYGAPLFLKVQGAYFRNPDVNRAEDFAGDAKSQMILDTLKPRETRPSHTFNGVGETEALFHLTRLLASRGAALSIERSDRVGWEDMKGKHAIFLGGRKYNLQIPKFPVKPKFEAVNRRVVNLEPRPGEPAEYPTASSTPHGEITEEYALISVYPGFSHNTRLVALECSSTEGTLAAAEFLTRPDMLRQLIEHGVPIEQKHGNANAYQVVIGAKLNDGVVVSLFYKNHRVL